MFNFSLNPSYWSGYNGIVSTGDEPNIANLHQYHDLTFSYLAPSFQNYYNHHADIISTVNQVVSNSTNNIPTTTTLNGTEEETKNKKKKKKGPSDRHSKIKVKNRMRHRRTRLSIDVAKDLFGLQDMLNVDKASMAVQWLLVRAKPDITKLKQELNIVDPPDQSENSVDDQVIAINGNGEHCKKGKYSRSRSLMTTQTKRGKGEREVARQRAKERTLLKKQAQRGFLAEPLPQLQNVANNVLLNDRDNLFHDAGSFSTMPWPNMESTSYIHEQVQPVVNNYELYHDLGLSFEVMTRLNDVF